MSSRNPLVGIDPSDVFRKLTELGEAWSELHSAAAMLEEVQKSLLAKLTIDRITAAGSRALAETHALASDEYRSHIERMVEARRAANVARVRYQSAQVWSDLLRTQAATRRAEMSLGHLTP